MEKQIGLFIDSLPQRPQNWSTNTGNLSVSKIFEIYIFILVARKFKMRGWTLTHKKGRDLKTMSEEFIFRGSPGELWGDKKFSYLHFQCSSTNKEYELHVGVNINGLSQESHEIDVGLFDCQASQKSRINKSRICGLDALLTIECKKYNYSRINKRIARECLGIAKDTERCIYSSPPRWGLFTTNLYCKSVENLLEANDIHCFCEIEPGQAQNVLDFGNKINEFITCL